MAKIDLWMNASNAFIRHRYLLDIAEKSASDPLVRSAKAEMAADPKIRQLLDDVREWPGTVLNSHKSASQNYHKMIFLADLGFDESEEAVHLALERMRKARRPEGTFSLPTTVSTNYGGTGLPTAGWALCDAPILLTILADMAFEGKAEARQGAEFVAALGRRNGFPCAVSLELGSWHGPGKRTEPCPDATLVALKLLSRYPDLRDGEAARAGTECLLDLWENSWDKHPYMFSMGTDFRKLKAPFIWYDILHVTDVLSLFPHVRTDPRFLSMLGVIRAKADSEGLYAPESVWQAWKDWEFSQKGRPSLWISLLVRRIETRLGA